MHGLIDDFQEGHRPVPRYVAISHVWSDGMGNNDRNALPLCILRKVQRQVNDLFDDTDGPVPFWIDTICVPKTNKIPALEIMTKSYGMAAVVLVLDAGLELTSITASPQERLLKIKTSSWMHRLWTLQEGLFAKQLSFRFAEGASTATSILEACYEEPSPMKLSLDALLPGLTGRKRYLCNRLIRGLGADSRCFDLQGKKDALISGLSKMDSTFPTDADKRLGRLMSDHLFLDPIFKDTYKAILGMIANRDDNGSFLIRHPSTTLTELKKRHTSRLEDESYCLANLMGVQVLPVLAVAPRDRLKKVLTMMPEIPVTVLFSHQVSHFEEDGFRWAPTTFMTGVALSYDTTCMGRIEGKGLQVSLSALTLQAQCSLPDDHELELGVHGDRITYQLSLLRPLQSGPPKWSAFNGQELRILLRYSLYSGRQRLDAALTTLVSEGNCSDTVRFETVVFIGRTGRLVEESLGILLGGFLPERSQWCVW